MTLRDRSDSCIISPCFQPRSESENAGVAELADAYGSGPYECKLMKVQVLSPAPFDLEETPCQRHGVSCVLPHRLFRPIFECMITSIICLAELPGSFLGDESKVRIKMVGQSNNPIKRSPIEWLRYLEGNIPYVDTALRSPNSSFRQWVDSYSKFPNLVGKVRAFYEPLGFEVWVEGDRRSNLKTLYCKPRNLESVIAYAERINPGAKKTIRHYASDAPSLREFVRESLKHSSGKLIYFAKSQVLSSYPKHGTSKRHATASLDLDACQIENDYFVLAIYALIDEYSSRNDKSKIRCRSSCNEKGEWVFELYYDKTKKVDDRIGRPLL